MNESMIKNYLKIALRTIRRHPSYSLLNISGLALGMASALLILLYVQDELSFDRYHDNSDRIYRIINLDMDDGDYEGIAKVNGPWAQAAVEAVPEVEVATRFTFFGQALIENEAVREYQGGGFFADSVVFDIFDFEFIVGNPQTALLQPQSIVLTEEMASIYFGDGEALGQTLEVDNSSENTLTGAYTVTGVIKNVPEQSHFTFRYLVSMSTYRHPDMTDWVLWNQFYTYVLLNEGTSPESAAATFASVLPQHYAEDQIDNYNPAFQPLVDIHLHSNLFREIAVNGDARYVYIFSCIAFFILLIACINFINLSTAQSTKRNKEVGIRKVSGANRYVLIRQFLSESFLLSLFSIILAVGVALFFLNTFNELTGKALISSQLIQGPFVLGLVGLWIVVSFLAGGYPALLLSSFKPAAILKGRSSGTGHSMLRKGLVVFQFAISAFLIIATGIVLQQVDYMQTKKLGFNQEQLINFPIRDDALRGQADAVKQALLQHPTITHVSVSGNMPGGGDWGIPLQPEGIAQDDIPPTRILAIDEDFVETFQMEVAVGRDFSSERPAERELGYIINQEAAKQYGWDNPLEKTIAMPAIGRAPGPVIGVVEDFHFRSMREEIGPMVMFAPPQGWFSVYSVRVAPGQVEEALTHLETVVAGFDPEHPFTYSFFDERFGQLHAEEARMGELMKYFAFLGIVIACMGLLGLAVFIAQQRTKEIGIRKVLGASVRQVTFLLTKEFTSWVIAGFILAVPFAYLAGHQWLEGFVYQAKMSIWIFLGAGIMALLIAWLTVGVQSIRAALTDPVKALKYE